MYESILIPISVLLIILALVIAGKNQSGIITPWKVTRITGLLAIILFFVFAVSIQIGPARISPLAILQRLLYGWRDGYLVLSAQEEIILYSIRIPRALFAGIVGGALSVAGVVFQALLRNPLADPYILGISGGASVGAIVGIITGAGSLYFGIPGLAFAGALLTILLVFGSSVTRKELQPNTLLLSGVIVNAFFTAIIILLISTSANAQLRSIFFWLMGDLSLAGKNDIMLIGLLLIIVFLLIFYHARSLNLIIFGEETALQLGVHVEKTKILLLAAASLITAVTVSVSGPIGFVGLIIPHMMRMVFGPDHRLLLPSSLLFGGAFMMAADTIARSIMAPSELPVGVITAICGAPYFIYLLRRKVI
jgi:iron complex transport system permease protein